MKKDFSQKVIVDVHSMEALIRTFREKMEEQYRSDVEGYVVLLATREEGKRLMQDLPANAEAFADAAQKRLIFMIEKRKKRYFFRRHVRVALKSGFFSAMETEGIKPKFPANVEWLIDTKSFCIIQRIYSHRL